jgi:glycine/serine hydroxymethyltransferase
VSLRGMRRPEILEIGALIGDVLEHVGDPAVTARVGDRVGDLCRRFPLPGSAAPPQT